MAPLSNMAVRDIETVMHPYTNLRAIAKWGRWCSRRGAAFMSIDSTASATSRAWPGCGAPRSAMATRELVDAATAADAQLSYTHLFGDKSNDLAIELSEKLKEMAPCEASKILFCSSGSEANDMQVKLTWYYNNALGRPRRRRSSRASRAITASPSPRAR